MERFGDLYLDLNQNEANLEDVNLNAVLVELDKGWLFEENLPYFPRIVYHWTLGR